MSLSAEGTSIQIFQSHKEKHQIRLTPPKKITFWITLSLAILGVIGTFISIPFVSALAIWFVFVAYALLALSLIVKGL